jgi:hypothetical protein
MFAVTSFEKVQDRQDQVAVSAAGTVVVVVVRVVLLLLLLLLSLLLLLLLLVLLLLLLFVLLLSLLLLPLLVKKERMSFGFVNTWLRALLSIQATVSSPLTAPPTTFATS